MADEEQVVPQEQEEVQKEGDEAEKTEEAAEGQGEAGPTAADIEAMEWSYPDPSPFQSTPLYDAIRDEKEDKVAELVKDANMELRDIDGSSYLHYCLKVRSKADIVKALLPYSDLSVRDENGLSVIDLALENQDYYGEHFLKQVEQHMQEMMVSGDTVRLENMVIGGLEVPRPSSAKRKEITDKSEEMDNLLDAIDGYEEKISQLHSAVHQGELDNIKSILEKKKLAKARDVTGMLPLHKAVVFENLEVLQYLAESFPVLIDTTDHVGRTALHYAAVSDNEQLYQTLVENGASEDATDLKGCTASYYKENKDLIVLTDIQEKILERTAQPRRTMRSRPTTAERRAKSGLDKEMSSEDLRSKQSSRRSVVIPTYDPKRDPFLVEKAPPPKTPDTMYVADNLGEALTLALTEIVDKRPWDPIEFLSQWLIHYSKQAKYQAKMKAENDRLEGERLAAQEELDREERCKQEIKEMEVEAERLRKEEEEKQRLKELEEKRKQMETHLPAPDLPTVAEESEAEPESARLQPKPGLRDTNGQTELHRAAVAEESNLAELLESGFDVTMRDINGKTAVQLAEEAEQQANKDAIDAHVLKMFESGDLDHVTQLILSGYENLPNLDEKFPELEGLSEEVKAAWTSREETQEQTNKARDAVINGDLESVQSAVTTSQQAGARDQKGHTLLHEAVLNIKPELVNHILENYKEIIDNVDNYDRSALHYAAAIDGTMYTALRAQGADEALADIFGKMAVHYVENRSEIFSAVDGLEELVEVHIAQMAAEISETADAIQKRASSMGEEEPAEGEQPKEGEEGETEAKALDEENQEEVAAVEPPAAEEEKGADMEEEEEPLAAAMEPEEEPEPEEPEE